MNTAVIKSYWRSVRRGTRTIESVPEALRGEVQALLEADEQARA